MKVILWNARSILPFKEELQEVTKDIVVFICVELWLTPTKEKFDLPGLTTFRKDCLHSRGGGILILLRNSIAFKEIEVNKSNNETVELCGLKITNVSPNINLFICYRAPGILEINEWSKIFSNLNNDNITSF